MTSSPNFKVTTSSPATSFASTRSSTDWLKGFLYPMDLPSVFALTNELTSPKERDELSVKESPSF